LRNWKHLISGNGKKNSRIGDDVAKKETETANFASLQTHSKNFVEADQGQPQPPSAEG
jgi:hypothetical protein